MRLRIFFTGTAECTGSREFIFQYFRAQAMLQIVWYVALRTKRFPFLKAAHVVCFSIRRREAFAAGLVWCELYIEFDVACDFPAMDGTSAGTFFIFPALSRFFWQSVMLAPGMQCHSGGEDANRSW
jgi:hypothetical protein